MLLSDCVLEKQKWVIIWFTKGVIVAQWSKTQDNDGFSLFVVVPVGGMVIAYMPILGIA